MKNSLAFLLLVFFFAALFSSCSVVESSEDANIRQESFTVRIDSIQAPTTINTSDTLSVQLFGTIGPDGCHGLKAVQKNRSETAATIQVIGQRTTGPVFCTAAIVELNYNLEINPPFTPGVFTIRINQPDNTFLNREVTIE